MKGIFIKIGSTVASFHAVWNDSVEEETLMMQKRNRNYTKKILDWTGGAGIQCQRERLRGAGTAQPPQEGRRTQVV